MPQGRNARPAWTGLSLVLALAALGGCTSLKSVRLVDKASAPSAGIPYNLTFTQFKLTLTRSVSACGNGDSGEVELASEFSFSSSEVRDSSHEYVLDMNSLRSFFKTTEVSVTYHPNGALATLNAKAKDETGAFVQSIVGTAAKLAVQAAAPSAVSVSLASGEKSLTRAQCLDETSKALAGIKEGANAVSKAALALQDATDDFASLLRLGGAASGLGGSGWRQDLRAAIDRLKTQRQQLRTAQKALQADQDALRIESLELSWPGNGEVLLTDGKTPEIAKLNNEALSKRLRLPDSSSVEVKGNDAFWLGLGRESSSWSGGSQADSKATEVEGLRYRKGMPGWLSVYTCAPSDGKWACAAAARSDTQVISQLGPLFALSLKNYPFMTQNISAEFDEGGRPVMLGYFSEATSGKLSSAVSDVADQWIKVKEARKPKTELEVLNEQLSLQKARNDLAAAKNVAAAATDAGAQATAGALAAKALAEAKLAQLKAEQALAEFMTKPSGN